MVPAWKKSKEPGGCRSWGRGENKQGAVPKGAALPSRVLGLEIPADVGYFCQEGVIRNRASQQPFRRKRIQMPVSFWAPGTKVNVQSAAAAEKGPGG